MRKRELPCIYTLLYIGKRKGKKEGEGGMWRGERPTPQGRSGN